MSNERSPLKKVGDFVGIVGAFATAYTFDAAARNTDIYDLMPDVGQGTYQALSWAALAGAIASTGLICSRQR